MKKNHINNDDNYATPPSLADKAIKYIPIMLAM